jgi:gluconate 2-dehydrogenase gamma chain
VAACDSGSGGWRAFTDAEAATLGAACDAIVPPDEDPGAAEAGVVAFVDRQLATREKDRRPLWRAGLRGLEATARRRHGRSFAELSLEARTGLLRDVENGAVDAADWTGIAPTEFFALLRDYTLMGFYGDPRHGGNRDRVAWRMLGLPDPPIRGRFHVAEPPPPRSRS